MRFHVVMPLLSTYMSFGQVRILFIDLLIKVVLDLYLYLVRCNQLLHSEQIGTETLKFWFTQ